MFPQLQLHVVARIGPLAYMLEVILDSCLKILPSPVEILSGRPDLFLETNIFRSFAELKTDFIDFVNAVLSFTLEELSDFLK